MKNTEINRRRNQRIRLENLVADLSDGSGFFSGIVSDVSRSGMQLVHVPKKFNDQAEKLILIVSDNKKNFRIVATPRWVRENTVDKSMGVQIFSAPLNWSSFIRRNEPKENDVWAMTSLGE